MQEQHVACLLERAKPGTPRERDLRLVEGEFTVLDALAKLSEKDFQDPVVNRAWAKLRALWFELAPPVWAMGRRLRLD